MVLLLAQLCNQLFLVFHLVDTHFVFDRKELRFHQVVRHRLSELSGSIFGVHNVILNQV